MPHPRKLVQRALRRLGYEVSYARNSVPGQRAQLLSALGIERVIDVGANVGQYARSLRELGYHGEIVSLEPLRQPYDELARAAADDPRWIARRTAIGAEVGELVLHVSEASIFSSALDVLPNAVAASANARQVADEAVPMTTLDQLLAGDDLHRTAIKIDVQGLEREVLTGAQDALERVPLLEMEVSPRPVYRDQMLLSEALERLDHAGLVLSVVENLLRDPVTGRSLQFNGIFARVDSS